MFPVNHSCVANDSPQASRLALPSEQGLYVLAGRLSRWFAGAAAVLCLLGLYVVFRALPDDPHYSQHYRILLLHIPVAWMALGIYAAMVVSIVLGRATSHRFFGMMASAMAPTGAMFAFLSLWTGSLWWKPTWGVWWVWNLNAVSALALLLLCLSFVVLQMAVEDTRRADRLSGNLALLGLAVLPMLYFCIGFWGGDRAAPLSMFVPPAMVETAVGALKLMAAGLIAYTVAVTLTRLRIVILERERRSDWVARLAAD